MEKIAGRPSAVRMRRISRSGVPTATAERLGVLLVGRTDPQADELPSRPEAGCLEVLRVAVVHVERVADQRPRVTYVPEPWRRTTSPSSIRPWTASRIVTRLTPNRSHRRSSFGSFEPTRELAAQDQALQLAPDDVGEERPAAGRADRHDRCGRDELGIVPIIRRSDVAAPEVVVHRPSAGRPRPSPASRTRKG